MVADPIPAFARLASSADPVEYAFAREQVPAIQAMPRTAGLTGIVGLTRAYVVHYMFHKSSHRRLFSPTPFT
jgi:hypothetical protein